MRQLSLLGVFVMLQGFSSASAQEPTVLVPGARVRITESGERAVQRGTIVTAGADTISLKGDRSDETIALSRAGITRVEVSRGLHGHTGAGIGLGFLVGFSAGALIGYNTCGTCGGGEDEQISRGLEALAWGGILGATGMLVGGLIGAHHKTDQWEEVPPSRWQLTAVPDPRGVTIAFALSW